MAPSITSLSPADMSNLGNLQPIRFSVIDDAAPLTSAVLLWIKTADAADKVLIYDSAEFSNPYDDNSTLVLPEGTDKNQDFTILPEGGWPGDIEELRVEFYDEGDGVGTIIAVSNLSPAKALINSPDFDLSLPISFDVDDSAVDFQSVAVWIRFADEAHRVMVYETDGFPEGFQKASTISGAGGTRSFSLLEDNGWRARPAEIFVWAVDVNGDTLLEDILL